MSDYRTIEFGQLPLLIGPLIGLRTWCISGDTLTGVHKRVPWGPGENVAECLRTAGEAGYGYHVGPKRAEDYVPHPERAPFIGCVDGFYGYFDGSNTYMTTARVAGLIEGYGRMIVGTRGFRAEKARIVALIEPEEMTDDGEFEWRSVCVAYPNASVFTDLDEALARFPLTPVDLSAVSAVEKQAS